MRAISVHAGPTRRNPALERASIGSSEPFDAPPRANAKNAPVNDGRVFPCAAPAAWPRAPRATIAAMLSRLNDPIVAIATAPGRGAVGIVRVSGRACSR